MSAADRRAHALGFIHGRLRKLIYNPQVRPHWIGDSGRFWYRREHPDGVGFVAVNAADGTSAPAFDHAALAAALQAASGQAVDAGRLKLDELAIEPDGTARFLSGGRHFIYTPGQGCREIAQPEAGPAGQVISPDGRHAVFRRGDDLWLREIASGAEHALTTDGAPHHAYGKSSDMNLTTITLVRRNITLPAVALWSPDSRTVLTSHLDERAVADTPMVQHVPDTKAARPVLHNLKIALSGEEAVPTEQLLLIDIASGRITPAKMPPLIVGVMTCIEREEAWWSEDGRSIWFIDRDRLSRRVTLHRLDVASGDVAEVMTETAATFHDVNVSVTGLSNVRILDRSGEFIWFSQRDGYGHLYLHDLATGALKNRITQGDWLVRDLVAVDEKKRQIRFLAGGVDPAENPYYRTLCQANLDGTGFTVLTPEAGDHAIATPAKRVPRDHIRPVGEIGEFQSPCGRYFVHTHSTLERAPVSILRRADGERIDVLEHCTIDASVQPNWRWPMNFTATAADGKTTLYGAIWLPGDFDPVRKYAVIDNIYPGPQRGQTPTAMLTDVMPDLARSALPMAFAELGFVVINVDGRGTPLRSKAFHDESYGKLDDPGMLADHVAVLRQLAERHPWMDLTRVGIMGHSGGGYASVRAMLEYPEVFHAAVATAGNHDQKGYSFTWCEKYQGPMLHAADGTTNYDSAANGPIAHRLQGKLLLAYGDMDDNVHPALTLQLVAALIAADKDFDLIVLPNDDHTTVWNNVYFLRRAMEFMQRHLGAEESTGL